MICDVWANRRPVPCGIYDDGRRFQEMKEDARSVAKAVAEISGHAEQVSFGGNKDAVAYHMNQSVRVSLEFHMHECSR